MFKVAIKALSAHLNNFERLRGHTLHGEAVCKHRHNIIRYERLPTCFFVLFDVQDPNGKYVSRDEVVGWATLLRLEVTPLVYHRLAETEDPEVVLSPLMQALNETENGLTSFLGGKLEVVATYNWEAIGNKARQHLAEAGNLEPTNAVITRELWRDFLEENEENLKQSLFDAFLPLLKSVM